MGVCAAKLVEKAQPPPPDGNKIHKRVIKTIAKPAECHLKSNEDFDLLMFL